MSKIRLPRKLKKLRKNKPITGIEFLLSCYPYVPKILRYEYYYFTEYFIGFMLKSPDVKIETLHFFEHYYNYIVWWNWVRKKHLGIEPILPGKSKELWNMFCDKKIITYDKQE